MEGVCCQFPDFIDAEGNRVYIPCVYVLNKIDAISIEELGQYDFKSIAFQADTVACINNRSPLPNVSQLC